MKNKPEGGSLEPWSLDSQLRGQRNYAERWSISSHVSNSKVAPITDEFFLVQCCVSLGHNPHWLPISSLQLGGTCVRLGLVVSQAEVLELERRGGSGGKDGRLLGVRDILFYYSWTPCASPLHKDPECKYSVSKRSLQCITGSCPFSCFSLTINTEREMEKSAMGEE